MTVDRRIVKTQNAIKKAFFELMAKKDFKDITVNNICEVANLNRSTFYLHYLDKYDLLDKCIAEQFTMLLEVCASKANAVSQFPTYQSILATTEYFQEHFFFYSYMLKDKGMPSFRERLLDLMATGIHQQINMNDINKDLNKEVIVQFMASAIVGIVEWWIINNMPISANQLAKELWTLLERNQIHQ